VGFGTEFLFICVLGVLLLGPKRMATFVGHLARTKAQLEHARRNFKAQLDAEVEPTFGSETPASYPETPGEQ
jgi:Sec-independent protein translocase protein TatA